MITAITSAIVPPPTDSACFKRVELWQTYKFCFGRFVRQYQGDEEESTKAMTHSDSPSNPGTRRRDPSKVNQLTCRVALHPPNHLLCSQEDIARARGLSTCDSCMQKATDATKYARQTSHVFPRHSHHLFVVYKVRFVCKEQRELSASLLASIAEDSTCHCTANVKSHLLC